MSTNTPRARMASLRAFPCAALLLACVSSLPVSTGAQGKPEATSLFGKPLHAIELPADARKTLEANLAQAEAEYAKNPKSEEAIIWLGRRQAYLWRYQDAIDTFSKGLALHPKSYKLYRHRGHRYITVREFDRAIADFEKAAALIKNVPDEVEPDGAPNKYGKPRSTSHSNIWYHLGLAYYLKGDFTSALRAYQECMKFSKNDDMRVATLDWLYMTYRRLGRHGAAKQLLDQVTDKMEILENDSYHKRLLMYKGAIKPEQLLDTTNADDLTIATQGYGVGNFYLVEGNTAKAKEIFEKVVAGRQWAAFGYIAAEADLNRSEGRGARGRGPRPFGMIEQL
jgi:tetratricopeptide (TPR) repeat protein